MESMWNVSSIVSCLALLASAASISVAVAVWRTSREKLRLDLYDRRFDIYSRALDFYHVLLPWDAHPSEKSSHGLEESPQLREAQTAFIKASRASRFLFDDPIHKILEQMGLDAMGIIAFKRDLAPSLPMGQPEEVLGHLKEYSERWERVNESFPLLEQEMSRYLNFHKL
jgi:hypothetical protein